MWGVDPALMCQQHLLGEHVEMHMLAGSIRKGISLEGYINGGLVETDKLVERHEALAAEMAARGYNHKSPLPIFDVLVAEGKVDREANLKELARRCPECAKKSRLLG
jgi:hypothetical protein